MSKFSKKGVLMVYSNDERGEEGGTEEAGVAPVVISELQDALKQAQLAPVTPQPATVNKDLLDDDDVCPKLSDLPDDYFDDLLDLDYSVPVKKPKLRQLILLENGKLDYAPECREPKQVQLDISAEEVILPGTKESTKAPSIIENAEPPSDTATASAGPEQPREKLKITFNKKLVKMIPLRANLLPSLFGEDDDKDLEVPMPKLEESQRGRKNKDVEKIIKSDEKKTKHNTIRAKVGESSRKKSQPLSVKYSRNDEKEKHADKTIRSRRKLSTEDEHFKKSHCSRPRRCEELKQCDASGYKKQKAVSPARESTTKKQADSKRDSSRATQLRKTPINKKPTSPIPTAGKIGPKGVLVRHYLETFLHPSTQKSSNTFPSPCNDSGALLPTLPKSNGLMQPHQGHMNTIYFPHPPHWSLPSLTERPSPSANCPQTPQPNATFGAKSLQYYGCPPVILSSRPPVLTKVSPNNLNNSLVPVLNSKMANTNSLGAKSMASGNVDSSAALKDRQCCVIGSGSLFQPPLQPNEEKVAALLPREEENPKILVEHQAEQQITSKQMESLKVKNFCAPSTSNDPVLLPTCESSNQEKVETAHKEVGTHPLCSISEGVKCNLECQDCAIKSQIIASVRKFAESMLSKNINVEAMNMLLQMVGSASELQKKPNPDSFQSSDFARGLSPNEIITKTVACTQSNTSSNKFCLNSLEGQMNPSLSSESAGAPSFKSENSETLLAAATIYQKFSGEVETDKKELSKPAARDKCKEMVNCENKRGLNELFLMSTPKENSVPLKATRVSPTLMLDGKNSNEQANENLIPLTDDAESPLIKVTDICSQISKCDEAALKQASPVYQTKSPSDKLLIVNGINQETVKLLTEDTNLVLTKCSTNNQVQCGTNELDRINKCVLNNKNKNPPKVVAPLNQIKYKAIRKRTRFDIEAEKCKVTQPLNNVQLKTQVASSLPVTNPTEVTQTRPGTSSGRTPCSSPSRPRQTNRILNPRSRTIHQAKYEGSYVGLHNSGETSRVQGWRFRRPLPQNGPQSRQPAMHEYKGDAYFTGAHTGPQFVASPLSRHGSRRAKESHWREANDRYQPYWRNNHDSYMPYNMVSQLMRPPFLPAPHLLQLRGLRPVFWHPEDADDCFEDNSRRNYRPDEMYDY